MAFRDDGDALLARAEALERENERLKEQLEEAEREDGDDERQAAEKKAAEQRAAAAEEELKRVKRELQEAKGPSLAQRASARVKAAAAKVRPGPVEGGYWAAATVAWRTWIAGVVLLVVAAAIGADMTAALAAAVYAVGAPVAAAVFAFFPWLAGYRQRKVAAGAAGLAIALSALTFAVLLIAGGAALIGKDWRIWTLVGVGVGVLAATVTLRLLRVLDEREDWWLVVCFLVPSLMPSPLTVLFALFAIAYVTHATARLAGR
jgi:hypothetical protein